MHLYISTATSLALSHEVNPGVQEFQFWLSEENPGPTSAACVFLAAAEQAALWPGRVKGVALSEADGEGVVAEEAAVASPLCVNCLSLWMRVGCDCALNLCDCASGVFAWALGLERGRRPLP